MSRIGKQPIQLPPGVKACVAENNEVSVQSGQNLLKVMVKPVIQVQVKEGFVILTRKTDQAKVRAWHGLYRALLYNAVVGVSKGWTKTLTFKGVGYKANVKGSLLELNLGYSHPIKMNIPKGLTVKVEKTNILVSGFDREQVGQFSAQIRSLREPEPYLGKGIRYSDEVIRRKSGKSGAQKK